MRSCISMLIIQSSSAAEWTPVIGESRVLNPYIILSIWTLSIISPHIRGHCPHSRCLSLNFPQGGIHIHITLCQTLTMSIWTWTPT